MTLYDFLPSGNGYKVRLLLSHLGLAYEYVALDILAGETRRDWFLEKNPNGRIPVLELDDGRVLPESNAILFYLAQGSQYWPDDSLAQAQVLRWLFFEQYSHEPHIATARFWLSVRGGEPSSGERVQLQAKWERGAHALAVMDRHLRDRRFLVDERYGIADIALYAYTHLAHEGGFDLQPYTGVRAWLDRVRAQPGHVSIAMRPAGAAGTAAGRGA